MPDEQRQHKSRKLTIILGLDDIQAKDEARQLAKINKLDFDENASIDGSGLKHLEAHMDSIRDYLDALPKEEQNLIGYSELKTQERGLLLAWLKSLPNYFKKEGLLQLKRRNSYRQKTAFVYGTFIMVIGLEDKPTDPFKAVKKVHQNDFNYVVTFFKSTPEYIKNMMEAHEFYMDYKNAVEQGYQNEDAVKKFNHLTAQIKKTVQVEVKTLKRRKIITSA